ncbi:MAG: GNAT family N-acetyltransferase [Leptospirales bacterium]|nr:GNAT family N-acetyltransferase [Leptospirales bacterium]
MRFETDRLVLRRWLPSDLGPFQRMNADPYVMRYFPSTRTNEESAELLQKTERHFEEHGFGVWALELKATGEWIGLTGAAHVPFEAHFTPAVELGWRIVGKFHGQGYATEAARFTCEFAFKELKLSGLVAFTIPANLPSRRVMEKLGMKHNPAENFNHPLVPPDSPARVHVLYRLSSAEYRKESTGE